MRRVAVLVVLVLAVGNGAAYALASATGHASTPAVPAPKITSAPTNPTYATDASFTYTDTRTAVGFICALDGAKYTECDAGASYLGLKVKSHAFCVKAVAGVSKSGATCFRWKIAPPPAPTFTATPHNPSPDTSATFAYADALDTVTFTCALDTTRYTACGSSASFSDLRVKAHVFCVEAIGAAASKSHCFHWTISTKTTAFTVTGNASRPLYPGGADVPVDVAITNPNTGPITVDAITIAATSSTPSICASFVVQSKGLRAEATIPARTTKSLSALGIASSLWPELTMTDDGQNQNICQGASISLALSGTAVR